MKNRMMKFMIMLLTVIILGGGATMLNLSLRAGTAPPERPYGLSVPGPPFITEETRAYSVKNTVDEEVRDMYAEQKPQMNSLEETKGSIAEQNNTLVEDCSPADDIETMGDSLEQAVVSETQPEADVETAVETMDPYSFLISASTTNESRQAYYARLQDMERVQVSLMGAAMRESLAEQQSAADTVLKLWDDELNSIYQRLKERLSEDDFSVLRAEERAWIRSRDEAAGMAASRENYGNSARNLAYTRSLLDWTKARVYELAEMYYGDTK